VAHARGAAFEATRKERLTAAEAALKRAPRVCINQETIAGTLALVRPVDTAVRFLDASVVAIVLAEPAIRDVMAVTPREAVPVCATAEHVIPGGAVHELVGVIAFDPVVELGTPQSRE